jgi:hypothetical protein
VPLRQLELDGTIVEDRAQLQPPAKRVDVAGERPNPRVGLMLDVRDRPLRCAQSAGEVHLGHGERAAQVAQRNRSL